MYYDETASTIPPAPEVRKPDIYDLAGEPRPKLCINCKHIGRNGSGDVKQYRCFALQNIATTRLDLVTGETQKVFHFKTCYEARDDYPVNFVKDSCGAAGRWFEEAPPKFETQQQYTDRAQRSAAADLLSQLDAMK